MPFLLYQDEITPVSTNTRSPMPELFPTGAYRTLTVPKNVQTTCATSAVWGWLGPFLVQYRNPAAFHVALHRVASKSSWSARSYVDSYACLVTDHDTHGKLQATDR